MCSTFSVSKRARTPARASCENRAAHANTTLCFTFAVRNMSGFFTCVHLLSAMRGPEHLHVCLNGEEAPRQTSKQRSAALLQLCRQTLRGYHLLACERPMQLRQQRAKARCGQKRYSAKTLILIIPANAGMLVRSRHEIGCNIFQSLDARFFVI